MESRPSKGMCLFFLWFRCAITSAKIVFMELGLNLHVVDKVAGFSRARTIPCGGIPANFCARLPFSPTLARVRCGLLFPPICEIIILCVSDFFSGSEFLFLYLFLESKIGDHCFLFKVFHFHFKKFWLRIERVGIASI